jgi:siroheme decarboxylase
MTQNSSETTASQKSIQINLDDIDKKILQVLQDNFPIVEKPWLEISNRLKINEDELITRLKRLTEAGVVLKIGPIVDSSKMGLKAATLIAMKVPKNQVNAVASIINKFGNVSHNYEREDEYNVWFTLAAPTNHELTERLNEIKRKTGVKEQDILNLPTLNRFKINVRFQLV